MEKGRKLMESESSHFQESSGESHSFVSSGTSSLFSPLDSDINNSRGSSRSESSYSSECSNNKDSAFDDEEALFEWGDSSLPQDDDDENDDDDEISPLDSSSSPILGISYPIFLRICSFLSENDYLTLLEVSRFFSRAITEADSVVWKALCFEKWKNHQGCHNLILFCRQLKQTSAKSEQLITALTQQALMERILTEEKNDFGCLPSAPVGSLSLPLSSSHNSCSEGSMPTSEGWTGNDLLKKENMNALPVSPDGLIHTSITATSCRTRSFSPLVRACPERAKRDEILALHKVPHPCLSSPPSSPFGSIFACLSHVEDDMRETSFSCSRDWSESRTSSIDSSNSSCGSGGSSAIFENSPTFRPTSPEFPVLGGEDNEVDSLLPSGPEAKKNIPSPDVGKLSFPTFHNRGLHRRHHRQHTSHHRGVRKTRRHRKKHNHQHHRHRNRGKSHHKKKKRGYYSSSHQRSSPKMSKSARRRRRHQRSKQRALLQKQQPLEPTATLNAIHSTTPSIPPSKVDPLPWLTLPFQKEKRNQRVKVGTLSDPAENEEEQPSGTATNPTYWWDLSHEERALYLSRQQRIQEQERRTAMEERSTNPSSIAVENGVSVARDGNDHNHADDDDGDACKGRSVAGKLSLFKVGASSAPQKRGTAPLHWNVSSVATERICTGDICRSRIPLSTDQERAVKEKGDRQNSKEESSRRVHFFTATSTGGSGGSGESRDSSFSKRKHRAARASAHLAVGSSTLTENIGLNTGNSRHRRRHNGNLANQSDGHISTSHSSSIQVLRRFEALQRRMCIARWNCASLLGMTAHFPTCILWSRGAKGPAVGYNERNASLSSAATSVSPLPSGATTVPSTPFSSTSPSLRNLPSDPSPVLGQNNAVDPPRHSCLPFASPPVPLEEHRTEVGGTPLILKRDIVGTSSCCPTRRESNLPHLQSSTALNQPATAAGGTTLDTGIPPSSPLANWPLSACRCEVNCGICSFPAEHGNQDARKRNDKGDNVLRYGPITWKFAYYMSRREARRKTITLHELVKGLWLACLRSTGKCHPVRFLENHQMEIFPPLKELQAEGSSAPAIQQNFMASNVRETENEEERSRATPVMADESVPVANPSSASHSRKEMPWAATSPIATEPFYVMQSGGALIVMMSNFNVKQSLSVHHRSILASDASCTNVKSTRGCHLPCNMPFSSPSVEIIDPQEKFNAEPNYSVSRLRRAAGNLVMSCENSGRVTPSYTTSASHSNLCDDPPSQEESWRLFQQPLNFNTAMRILLGWETRKLGSFRSSDYPLPTVSKDDQNAVDDDWGWTISNDHLKIFSVDVARPLYIEGLERACDQTEGMM